MMRSFDKRSKKPILSGAKTNIFNIKISYFLIIFYATVCKIQ